MTKALFLDRDGVINYDLGYVYKISEFRFIEGIFNLLKEAIRMGYIIIVITNQAGIGRGYYTEKDFFILNSYMIKIFEDKGIKITRVFFSPYHPEFGIGKYKKNHSSRKPNPGMLIEAQKEFDIDMSKSILIGDKISDIKAGVSAGVKKNILFSSDLLKDSDIRASYERVKKLHDAANFF
tara:strand:+ start:277 stop:816 length:540 start_codon:yes stop_codon:yes gene_type:complete